MTMSSDGRSAVARAVPVNRRKAIRTALMTIYDLSPFNDFLGGTLRLEEMDKEIARLHVSRRMKCQSSQHPIGHND